MLVTLYSSHLQLKALHLHRRFDPRRECTLRMYSYLLPVDVIGIKNSFTSDEIDHHISDFNEILNQFEVRVLHCFFSFRDFKQSLLRFLLHWHWFFLVG